MGQRGPESVKEGRAMHRLLRGKWLRAQQGASAGQFRGPLTSLAERFRVPRGLMGTLMTTAPEVLMLWASPGFVGDRNDLEVYGAEGVGDQFDGALLCHTLSGWTDSACLLAELGRFSRIARGMDLNGRIMLADIEWARLNWVAKTLALEDNLPGNLQWRQKLYQLLPRVTLDVCPPGRKDWPGGAPDHAAIDGRSSDHVHLARLLWGEGVTERRIEGVEAGDLESVLAPGGRRAGQGLLASRLVLEALLPYTEMLVSVARNLHWIDKGTLIYFLKQYAYQGMYPRYLKIAVRRERDFDEPFKRLAEAWGSRDKGHESLASVYFGDYWFTRDENGMKLTVHPYYFPSGELYRVRVNPREAEALCIMVTDVGKEGVSKVAGMLSSCDDYDRARFLADMLSFADAAALGSSVRRTFGDRDGRPVVRSWEAFAGAGDQYPKRVAEWGEIACSDFQRWKTVPYYFLPYLWRGCGITVEREAQLVVAILEDLEEAIGAPPELRAEPRL